MFQECISVYVGYKKLCNCVFRDPVHAEWVKAWINTLVQLQAYIKEFHTTGISWNKNVNSF